MMENSKKREETLKKNEEKEKKCNRWILPFIIFLLIIFFGFFTGLFDSEIPDSNSYPEVYKFPKNLTIGKNWTFNFSNHLIPLIKEENTSAPYIFYLGSKAGSLPEGLVLSGNGILEGKPAGNAGTFMFEVCVEDSIINILCKIYELKVVSGTDENLSTNEKTQITGGNKKCPVTSCDWQCCGTVTLYGGDMPDPTMIAFHVYDYCDCPSDTTYDGMEDLGDGKMYKLCLCNGYF